MLIKNAGVKEVKILKDKNNIVLKYGTKSAIITAVVLAVIIVLNIFAGSLNIKFDATKEKLYTLSEQSKNIISSLDTDVNMYALYEKGSEDPVIKEIFENYENLSSHIHTEFVDPYENPQIAMMYSTTTQNLSVGTVIVESGEKYRVITQNDMAEYGVDEATNMMYMKSFNVETCITSAISYVSGAEMNKIYMLKGHSEQDFGSSLLTKLQNDNYEIESLYLDSEESVPEDADIVVINSPMTDITEGELQKLSTYLSNDGRAFINVGIGTETMTNMSVLLSNYGIEANNAMTIEGSQDYVYGNNPYYIMPHVEQHDITKNMVSDEEEVFFPYAQGFEEVENKKDTLTIEPLLTTSGQSYGKKELDSIENFQKTDDDISGSFNIAVAVTDKFTTDTEHTTKIVALGGSSITDSNIDSYVDGGNYDFILNSINWLIDKDQSTSVPSKNIEGNSYLNIGATASIIIMFISVVLIPFVIAAYGIINMAKRKSK